MSEKPINEVLDEVDRYCAAATPGPWKPYHRVSPRGAHRQWHIGNKDGLCQITLGGGTERDYVLMAAAREDLPRLARELRQSQVGLNLFRQLVSGRNALRQLDVFACNDGEHDAGCECFWEQCEAWAKGEANQ